MDTFYGYPRTPHLEGSRLQEGDEDCEQIPLSALAGEHVVLEEKVDAANAGFSFSEGGELLPQSRGHYLVGGGRERQFNLFKAWLAAHERQFLDRFEDRFVIYGEFLHKKHSVYYDRLPHYFLEFDIWDRAQECFLSTGARRRLIGDLPILSVPVLYEGVMPRSIKELQALVRPSLAKSASWRSVMETVVRREGYDLEREWRNTDKSDLAEGLYGKVETGERCTGRFKWVRHDFVQCIQNGDRHHSEGPLVPNQLADGVDLYAERLTITWDDLLEGNTLRPHLLSREDFKRLVFARSGGRCVFCAASAKDAHHILDRKLWPDGGYHLSNGAAVCEEHHWSCETTSLSVEEVRQASGLRDVLLPPGFDRSLRYDKWGNILRADGTRLPGPLFNDPGARKALARGGVLSRFVDCA